VILDNLTFTLLFAAIVLALCERWLTRREERKQNRDRWEMRRAADQAALSQITEADEAAVREVTRRYFK